MGNTIISNQAEKTKKTKFDVRLFFAILTAAIVPVAADILALVANNLISSFQEVILDYIGDSIQYSFYVIKILLNLPELIISPLAVLVTAVICGILLKSFTKGMAAYGYSYIAFTVRNILTGLFIMINSIVQLSFYNGNPSGAMRTVLKVLYTTQNIVIYGSYILCPAIICILFILSEKLKSKKPDGKAMLTIKLIFTGLFPVAFFVLQAVIMISQNLILSYANSHDMSIYSASYSIHSVISAIVIALFFLIGVFIFITVFKDGKLFALTVTYTVVPYNLLVAGLSVSSSICWLIDENFFNGYTTEYIEMVLVALLIIVFILITTLFFVFLTVLPTVKAYKKELEEIKKAEEAEKADDSMLEYLDNIRFSEDMTDNYEYVYSENDEDNNEDYREISAEQYYSYE